LCYRFPHCKALELSVKLMSDEGLDLSSLDPGGPHRFWYQSRTVCRKPLLLVVVESSACENYLKAKNELQNVGKVSFYSLSLSILVLSFLILSC
jgi:hypothetical protein